MLAQGEVLERELAVAAAEDREEPEKVEQKGDHRTEIASGSGLRDQQLAHLPAFGEGQAIVAFHAGMDRGACCRIDPARDC
jgi:hypothetical protein